MYKHTETQKRVIQFMDVLLYFGGAGCEAHFVFK